MAQEASTRTTVLGSSLVCSTASGPGPTLMLGILLRLLRSSFIFEAARCLQSSPEPLMEDAFCGFRIPVSLQLILMPVCTRFGLHVA